MEPKQRKKRKKLNDLEKKRVVELSDVYRINDLAQMFDVDRTVIWQVQKSFGLGKKTGLKRLYPKKRKDFNFAEEDGGYYKATVEEQELKKIRQRLTCTENHEKISLVIEQVNQLSEGKLMAMFRCATCKAVLGSERGANHYYKTV